MKKNLTSFAENIYKFREKLNKSQSQFADYISKELKKEGIDFEYTNKSISKWESADSVPSVEVLIVLSKLMNVSMDTLLKDKIEQFNLPKENSTVLEMEERFKPFPNMCKKIFGRDFINDEILKNIALSITEYYDKDYVVDEELAGKILISCPYAIAFYKDNDISELEYLDDPQRPKVTILEDYVKDANDRKFLIRIKRKKELYTFKNTNYDWELLSSNKVLSKKIIEDINVSDINLFQKNLRKKYKKVKKGAMEYQNCNLLKEVIVHCGYDFDKKAIIFYLNGELNLSIEELKEIWKRIGVMKFYTALNDIGTKTVKKYLGDLLDE